MEHKKSIVRVFAILMSCILCISGNGAALTVFATDEFLATSTETSKEMSTMGLSFGALMAQNSEVQYNFALGTSTSATNWQSGNDFGNPAISLIDGDHNYGFVSEDMTQDEFDQEPFYITMEWGIPLNDINSLVLYSNYPHQQGPEKVNIEAKSSDGDWEIVKEDYTISWNNLGNDLYNNTVEFNAQSGVVGIRLHITEAQLGWRHISIKEIEIYKDASTDINLDDPSDYNGVILHKGNELTGISLGDRVLVENQDYSVASSNDVTTVVAIDKQIFVDYGMDAAATLTFTFNEGNPYTENLNLYTDNPCDLISINAPRAITGLRNGTAKTAVALGLPETVVLETDTGTLSANVTWDLDATSYDSDVKTEQEFTIPGTVTLPTNVANSKNIDLNTSITVMVRREVGNLALNKPTTASSIYSTAESSDHAVDGNLVSKWASGDKTPGDRWLAVDLGKRYTIDRWVVKHIGVVESSDYNTRDFELQKSDDGINWTVVDTVTDNTENITDRGVATLTTRYVRLYITVPSNNNDEAARISEFEIYESTETFSLISIVNPDSATGRICGTAKTAEALELPAAVGIETDKGSLNADVVWDVAVSEYEPTVKTAQTFTVDGTVFLPEGVDNSDNLPLTTSIDVTVNAAKNLISITTPTAVTGIKNETPKTAENLGLPEIIEIVTDVDNVDADVAWDVLESSYDPNEDSEQTFTVVGTVSLPASVVNPNNVNLETSIQVTVNAAKIVQSITSPTDITGLINGTFKSAKAFGLPETIVIGTDDCDMDADVAWDVEAANYNTEMKVEQIFQVKGTVALPLGVANPNGISLETTINVTVKKEESILTYPGPTGINPSDLYSIKVSNNDTDWQDSFTYKDARMADSKVNYYGDQMWDTHSITIFDMMDTKPVKVEITKTGGPITSIKVRPNSAEITATIEDGKGYYTLTSPVKCFVIINDDYRNPVSVLAGHPIPAPNPDDPNVIYYGPGVHTGSGEDNVLEVPGGKTLYLAGGAYLQARIYAEGDYTKIYGRGVVSSKNVPLVNDVEGVLDGRSVQVMMKGSHLLLQGITLMENHTVQSPRLYGDSNNTARDVRVSGLNVYDLGGNDSIAVGGASAVTDDIYQVVSDDVYAGFITNSFLATGRAGGLNFFGGGSYQKIKNCEIFNIQPPDSTVWPYPLNLTQYAADHIGQVLVEDCSFEGINIPKWLRFNVTNADYYDNDPSIAGSASHYVFRNCTFIGDFADKGDTKGGASFTGWGPDNSVHDVTFDNLKINGQYMYDAEQARVSIDEYCHDINFVVPTAAPGSFTLAWPENGATSVPDITNFKWSASENAVSYELILSKNSDLSNPIFDVGTVIDTEYTTDFDLDVNTTYYWKVIAGNGLGYVESSINSFTTGAKPVKTAFVTDSYGIDPYGVDPIIFNEDQFLFNGPSYAGYQFTPSSDVTVNALGRPIVYHSLYLSHELAIWRVSDETKIASVVVRPKYSRLVTSGDYRYEMLQAPVVLRAGEAYRIVSAEYQGSTAGYTKDGYADTDPWRDNNPINHTSIGTIDGPCYNDSSAPIGKFPNIFDGSERGNGYVSIQLYTKGAEEWKTEYIVNFYDGSTLHSSPSVDDGQSLGINFPSNPTKTDYRFDGWFVGQGGTGTQFTAATVVTGNLNVYAKWTYTGTVQPTIHTINFYDGSTLHSSPSVDDGQSLGINFPSNPTKTDYRFDGWFVGQGGTETQFTATTVVTGNLNVYAKWTYTGTVQPTIHTINFYDGSTLHNSTSVDDEKSLGINFPSNPTKIDYRFDGWFVGQGGTGTQFTAATVVTGNLNVYAKWTYTGTVQPTIHTINFYDGSTLHSSTSVDDEKSLGINFPSNPTKIDYRFDGWFVGQGGTGTQFTAATVVTGNLDIYAKWTYIGGKISKDSADYSRDDTIDSSRSSLFPTTLKEEWLDPNATKSQAANAKVNGKKSIRTIHNGKYGVQVKSWEEMAKANLAYEHDTMYGSSVQVRITFDEPGKNTKDTYVSSYVKGPAVGKVRRLFQKWFDNKVQVIHFNQTTEWEQSIQVAANIELGKMDADKLVFYSYDTKTNTYRQIMEPKYWVDQNGYLHFTTRYAGDIIISEKLLEKR